MATQRIRLVIFEGPEPGKEYEISGRVSIGRGKDADIQVEDVSISRKHIEIWTDQGVFYWKDLNSKFVLQVFRDWRLTRDRDYLETMVPVCQVGELFYG